MKIHCSNHIVISLLCLHPGWAPSSEKVFPKGVVVADFSHQPGTQLSPNLKYACSVQQFSHWGSDFKSNWNLHAAKAFWHLFQEAKHRYGWIVASPSPPLQQHQLRDHQVPSWSPSFISPLCCYLSLHPPPTPGRGLTLHISYTVLLSAGNSPFCSSTEIP